MWLTVSRTGQGRGKSILTSVAVLYGYLYCVRLSYPVASSCHHHLRNDCGHALYNACTTTDVPNCLSSRGSTEHRVHLHREVYKCSSPAPRSFGFPQTKVWHFHCATANSRNHHQKSRLIACLASPCSTSQNLSFVFNNG